MPIVQGFKLDINVDDLLRVSGAGEAQARISQRALESYQQVVAEAPELVDPILLYEEFEVSHVGQDRLTLASGDELSGRLLAKFMRTARKVVLICCSIGPRLEERVAYYHRTGATARAYLLDTVGSLAVDLVAQEGRRLVKELAESEGMSISAPLSPGQSGWPLTDQRTLFQLLEPGRIRVSLSQSCVMSPLKSTTLAIGIGPELGESRESACDYCPLKASCNFRRTTPSGGCDVDSSHPTSQRSG